MTTASSAGPWLTVIGIGDGGPATLAPDARAALGRATTIFGGRRHLAMLGETRAMTVEWAQPFSAAIEAIRRRRGRPTAILATGDPLWFGVGATLARDFGPDEMRVIPALSAFQLAAARLGWAIEEALCLSAHSRPPEAVARHLHPGARLLVLSADGETPRRLGRILTSRGYGPSRMTVLEHLGGPQERVRDTAAADFDLAEVADLNTVAIEAVAGRAAEPRPLVPGLPDEAFVHDGKMTKRVVRALAIAALEPMPGDLLWDVGTGSGSISVEWLRAGRGMRAVAIEPVDARRTMIAENAKAFGVPELEIVAGKAPDAFTGLPAPDAVFIGGGLSDAVFEPAFAALKPGGRLAAHAVTLESEAILIALHAAHGGALMRVAVETAEPVGPYRGFKPSMPVVHWHVTKVQL